LAAIESYGGDPRIIATRAEIERVQVALAAAGNILLGQLDLTDFLNTPLKRIGLAMEMPGVSERINYLISALQNAANEYFDGEALVAKELTDLGLVSAPIFAAGLIAIGNDAGLVREGPASAREIRRFDRSPPETLAQLARRTAMIEWSGRIAIERFGNTFVAYIPGTQSWLPLAGKNPLDLTSNLHAMKGAGLAASEKGLAAALQKSGAGPASKVYLVGHSQGGMVAANLALRDSRVAGIVTFGAPISQVAGQLKIPVVAIEHSNDVVPKLGLKANPLVENITTVVREVPILKPVDALVEAHDISNYAKTAELADEAAKGSGEYGLKRVREQVLAGIGVGSLDGAAGQVRVYELSRN
jgi:hypothetical protein